MATIDEQIAYVERELEFMEDPITKGAFKDDIPILKGILESLNKLSEQQNKREEDLIK